jgi:hypothetical protein
VTAWGDGSRTIADKWSSATSPNVTAPTVASRTPWENASLEALLRRANRAISEWTLEALFTTPPGVPLRVESGDALDDACSLQQPMPRDRLDDVEGAVIQLKRFDCLAGGTQLGGDLADRHFCEVVHDVLRQSRPVVVMVTAAHDWHYVCVDIHPGGIPP